ncbi:MAG: hypothetical protein ACYS99_22960 [Planctomycetota bacterium]
MREILLLLLLLPLLTGCALTNGNGEEGDTEDEEDEGRPFLMEVLFYFPNRALDALDLARFGVDVGLGVGVDVRATKYLQAVAMTRSTIGVGYQTLRHMPIQTGAYTAVGAGPVNLDLGDTPWYRSDTDLRAEVHLLLVGAHAAVDPAEILDLLLGFLTIDIMDDDY